MNEPNTNGTYAIEALARPLPHPAKQSTLEFRAVHDLIKQLGEANTYRYGDKKRIDWDAVISSPGAASALGFEGLNEEQARDRRRQLVQYSTQYITNTEAVATSKKKKPSKEKIREYQKRYYAKKLAKDLAAARVNTAADSKWAVEIPARQTLAFCPCCGTDLRGFNLALNIK